MVKPRIQKGVQRIAVSCAENQLCGLSLEAVFGFGHDWGSDRYSVVDLNQDLRFWWQIHGLSVLVIFKSHRLAGSVPSSWYSAIDNYIASNGGSTSSTSQQNRAGKARTESWAMFREHHVRNLLRIASSKDTAFVKALVRGSFGVHVR